MKKRMLLMAAAWVFASVAVVPVHAQRQHVRVKVPFAFVLGDKSYPVGDYVFSSERDHVVVGMLDGSRVAMLMANHVSRRSADRTGQVVFQCYDEQCFLSQVWTAGSDDGREVLRSRSEKEIAARRVPKYMALLGTPGRN